MMRLKAIISMGLTAAVTAVYAAAPAMAANASQGGVLAESLFTDMEDTEASILLSRLGIISGYEDGTFRPEDDVTRAETAAILVKAIGYSDEDIVNYRTEMSKNGYKGTKVSGFEDYNPDHWANVYIQLGTENGFISGFDDDTFRPDENVTKAQLITMLVKAVGYNEYAKASGGYPDGYLIYAASLGITNSSDFTDSSKNASRGEVLDFVRNELDAPLCLIDGYEVQWNGVATPVMVTKDGSGAGFQSLLTFRHQIYTVDAKVTDNTNTIKADILSSVNFENTEVTEKDKLSINLSVNKYSGQDITGTGKYKMFIKVNDSNEKTYELVYAAAE